MARKHNVPYPANIAQLAVREGVSADDAWRTYTALRLHTSREVFDTLYGEAQLARASVAAAMRQPLDVLPAGPEVQETTLYLSAGYLQRAQILQRDRATGQLFTTPYTIATNTLLTPRQVIAAGIDAFTSFADKYEADVVGGYFTGSFTEVGD